MGFLPNANVPQLWVIASSSWNKVWAGKIQDDDLKNEIKSKLHTIGMSFHKNASAKTLEGGNRGLLDEAHRLKLAQKLMKDETRRSKPKKTKEPRTCPHCHKEARIDLFFYIVVCQFLILSDPCSPDPIIKEAPCS